MREKLIKQIGYNIIEGINEYLQDSIISNVKDENCYQKLIFNNHFSIQFRAWINKPFYIILYNPKQEYIYEIDLSNIMYQDGNIQWYLAKPTKKENIKLLEKLFGQIVPLPENYKEFILKQKIEFNQQYPKIQGFKFIENENIEFLGEKVTKLVLEIFNTYEAYFPELNIIEAKNDKDTLVSFNRRERNGQEKLKLNLIKLYDGMCAVTGCNVGEVLEAAHINNHANTGNNHSQNALLLRADIHKLFDKGLIKIKPDSLIIKIDECLKDTIYWNYNDKRLLARSDGKKPIFTN